MGAQDKLPDALAKRHRVVNLSEGGTFIVQRWAIAKAMLMAGWMAGALKGVDTKIFEGADTLGIAQQLVQVLGDRVVEFLSVAVDPVDKATVLEIPADDALEVLQAIIELNITEKFRKKVMELFGLFKPLAQVKST